MPTFTTEVTATVDVEVEFEVFCSCGNGMCGITETRESRYRKHPQAVVEPCPKCLEEARKEAAEEVRDQMQQRIDELEAELENERRKLAA
jgi:Zn-finger protein